MTTLKRVIKTTGDGSQTLYLPDWKEHYHSVHGALAESLHVFIQHGFDRLPRNLKKVHILEVGFGTGLNALLSIDRAARQDVRLCYHALEPHPLSEEEVAQLNHPQLVSGGKHAGAFQRMHASTFGTKQMITSRFEFTLWKQTLEAAGLEPEFYELVYHDAFAPQFQPDLWGEIALKKIYRSLKSGGILVTYSARGSVKRALRACGFNLEHPPGPAGKREITVAVR